jgi:hypothetical protein
LCEVNWNEKLLGLSVDIADINTTLMGKVDPIALRKKNLLLARTCITGAAA